MNLVRICLILGGCIVIGRYSAEQQHHESSHQEDTPRYLYRKNFEKCSYVQIEGTNFTDGKGNNQPTNRGYAALYKGLLALHDRATLKKSPHATKSQDRPYTALFMQEDSLRQSEIIKNRRTLDLESYLFVSYLKAFTRHVIKDEHKDTQISTTDKMNEIIYTINKAAANIAATIQAESFTVLPPEFYYDHS